MKPSFTSRAACVEQTSAIASWFVVAILLAAYVSSILDRVVVSFVIQPIKHTFDVNDTAVSLLGGIAFTVFYTLVGIPAGRLADTVHRGRLIALGIAVWSVATILCGFASTFVWLFVARAGVAVGESVLNPAAYSLLATSFPTERRALALSIYSFGIPLGQGLAYVVSGIAVSVSSTPDSTLVVWLSELFATPFFPWQTVFVLVGAPGLAIALLALLFIRDTNRAVFITCSTCRTSESGSTDETEISSSSLLAALREALDKRTRRTLLMFMVGYGFFSFVYQGAGFWYAEHFVRAFAWSRAEIGFWYGLGAACCGTLGLLSASTLERIFHARQRNGALRVLILSAAGVVTCGTALPLVSSAPIAVVCLWLTALFGIAPYGVAVALLHSVIPDAIRARVSAVFLFIINVMGGAIAVIGISLLTDYILGSPTDLRYAIALVSAIGGGMALLLYMRVRAFFDERT